MYINRRFTQKFVLLGHYSNFMKPVNVLNIAQFKHDEHHEDFHANTLENHLETRHKDIAEPHSHNFYLAVLFTHGTGTHEIDFSVFDVKPGTLFFLKPGQTHHWNLSPDTKGYIFFHTREFYELYYTHNELARYPFFYSMHSSPCIYLTPDAKRELALTFKEVHREYQNGPNLFKQAIHAHITLLYVKATRLYDTLTTTEAAAENTYYLKFREFEDLVEQQYRNQKLPGYYADKLAVTLRHLNRITQAVVGKTATDVILERVLLEAKKELVLHRGNFKSIAGMLGYEDYGYFSKQFKIKTGGTPSQFVKRYIKQ